MYLTQICIAEGTTYFHRRKVFCGIQKDLLNFDRLTKTYNNRQSARDAQVFSLPDVGQHQQQGADDKSLKYLPVATEVRHPGHQQLTTQDHKTGHHGHGETPSWQAQLNPWQRKQRDTQKERVNVSIKFSVRGQRQLYDNWPNATFPWFLVNMTPGVNMQGKHWIWTILLVPVPTETGRNLI